MFQPVIKWSGSKRSQAKEIIKHFPKEIHTYLEPFCGGASVLRALIDSDIKVGAYVCSDVNQDLINLWNAIKRSPKTVYEVYEWRWHELNDEDDDKERKKRYFEEVRSLYNSEHSPYDFFFILRTTTNGMPRYNRNGEFNNSFHVTRNGILPEKVKPIIYEWSDILNDNTVQFVQSDFKDISTTDKVFMYLDPPYAGTKGMYYGGFNNHELFEWLRNQPAQWVMSYDGISGKEDNTYDVPEDLYSKHVYIKSGNSSFKRVIGKSNDSIVYESLYIK